MRPNRRTLVQTIGIGTTVLAILALPTEGAFAKGHGGGHGAGHGGGGHGGGHGGGAHVGGAHFGGSHFGGAHFGGGHFGGSGMHLGSTQMGGAANRGGYAAFRGGITGGVAVRHSGSMNSSRTARPGGNRNAATNRGTPMAQRGTRSSVQNLNNRQLPPPNNSGNSVLGATNAQNGLIGLSSSVVGNPGSHGYNYWGSSFLGSGYGNRGFGYGNNGYGYGNSGYGGYGNGNGPLVMVYLPGVGWVLVPLRAIRGMGVGGGLGMF